MKKIAVRINHTVEYELHFYVTEATSDEYIRELAYALQGADLALMDQTTVDESCKLIAEYNDIVNWDVVE